MTWEEITLQVNEEGKQLLEERHISEDEVKRVVYYAETEGKKLYQPEANRYLAKLRMGEATFYVEYSIEEEKFVVRTAYTHKSEIIG